MFATYLRRAFVGATICVFGGAIGAGVACSSSPRKLPIATSGTAGAAGSTTGSGTGTAGATSTGTGGDMTATGTAGTTGTGGDTTATGTAGAAGSTTSDAGAVPPADATGAGGDPGATGTAGAAGGTAGAAPVDNSLQLTTFPIPVTMSWYPSGWDGDAVTKAAFTANAASVIKIDDMSTATTGPCATRVTGHIGGCFRVTYTPVAQDGGAPGNASVALLPNIPGSTAANFADVTMAPHIGAGATTITAEVAGAVGGEQVSFNLWDAFQNEVFTPTLAAGGAWQKLSVMVPAGYDQELSPFGWGSSSTTPIVFYYDDVRINNN